MIIFLKISNKILHNEGPKYVIKDYPFSTYARLSEKLAFRVCIRG